MTGLTLAVEAATPLLHDERQLCAVLATPFSDEQLATITAPLEPAAIIAGAGSGKTAVMAARVVWLVGRGEVAPEQVLGLTFTTKAAAELGSRIRAALAHLYASTRRPGWATEQAEPTVSTYHAYAGGLVAEHGLRLGFEPDQHLVSDASCFQRAARVVQRCSTSLTAVSTDLPTVVREVVRLDAQLSDHLVEVDEVLRFDAELRERLGSVKPLRHVRDAIAASRKRDELLRLVAAYREAKAADGVSDFSDQMAQGALLAVRCPEVSRRERERYRVVLLDEYQDTSVSQRRLLQGLFSGDTVDDGRAHPVTAVGDPCQSIYGWRGASVDNLDGFPQHFPQRDGADAASYDLVVNRRCDRAIVQAANQLAAPLYEVFSAARPLRPRPDAGPGSVRTACLETVSDEIDWVVSEVVSEHRRDGVHWSDIALLVRDGSEIGALAAALRRHHVPVEVVGLCGMLGQPEVSDVVATLEVVHSLTANAALLRLLTGPRWRIGPRDLALLGERAGRLVDVVPRQGGGTLSDKLDRAVAGADPTDVQSLTDALEDPGPLPYSAAARARFAELAAELSALRRHAGDPLPDLARRVVETIGLDVELAADASPDAACASDNLALFLDVVGEFAAADPGASLSGLLAYLRAERDFNAGMAVSAPSAGDSVKLLTVHKAKGLEWPIVFLPFLAAKVFPNERGRERWTSTAAELPYPLRGDHPSLPDLPRWDAAGFAAFTTQVRRQALLEERRLAYVAVTRAKRRLVASAHWWGRTQKQPRGPSDYLRQLHAHCGGDDGPWLSEPGADATNPLLAAASSVAWPAPLDPDRLERRRLAAQAVRDAMAGVPATVPQPRTVADQEALRELSDLDAEIEALIAEAGRTAPDVVEVAPPPTLSATALMRMQAEPEPFAADLVRPMPRRPSRTARFGTRFHAWVESHLGQQVLLEPDDLPGAADAGITDEADLAGLIEAFRTGPFGQRTPCAVEAPFTLPLAGQVVTGRIDAVYAEADGFCVVDWKTNREAGADPLQLAVYRLAWAEMHGVAVERVRAAFYYVRTGEVDFPDLPGRAELEHQLCGRA